ncbi:MAG: helix-turn-helix domain-containing protein [Patescibacteria group bacterium]
MSLTPAAIHALNFSENELRVFEALEKCKTLQPASKIARMAGVPRTTALYILHKFEDRKIARRQWGGKKYKWRYDKRIEFMQKKWR